MILAFLFMCIIFIGYVLFITIKYGLLPSISESYYRLPKDSNILFTLFCWFFAFPAIVIGIQLTGNFLMFLAGASIFFVGAAAAFKHGLSKPVHMTSAYLAVVFSQLSIIFDFKYYEVSIIAIILMLILVLSKAKTYVFWSELITFASICYVFWSELF